MASKFFKFGIVGILSLISLVFVFAAMLWALFAIGDFQKSLILHFNLAFGINQFGSLWGLLGVVITWLIVVALNIFLAFELKVRDWFWGKFLAAATLFLSILLFAGFAAIISVN